MTCDSSSLSAGTRWVWIILQKRLSALGLTRSNDGPPQPVLAPRSPSGPLTFLLVLISLFTPAQSRGSIHEITFKDGYRTWQLQTRAKQSFFFLFSQAPHPPQPHTPMLVPFCPTSSAAGAASAAVRQRALLVYWCTLYWCELIPSGNTFGCHTLRFPFTASLLFPMFYMLSGVILVAVDLCKGVALTTAH